MKTEQPGLPGLDWKPRSLEKLYDSNQLYMSKWLESVKDRYQLVVVNASRQIGKSFWLFRYLTVQALENPGWQIKYGGKSQRHVHRILGPYVRSIMGEIPKDRRPKWSDDDSAYIFKNDATLTMAGCDKGYAELLVGQHAHLFVIDEGGAIKDLRYVVRDIAEPQTLNTGGRIIIASTPARLGGHAFQSFCEEAKAHGTYLERDIFENPRLTDETIRKYCDLAGGPDSDTWKREYLVQHITDEAAAGVPEATIPRLKALTVTDEQLAASISPWVDRYIAVVPMWNPNFTGVLWGHFDFRKKRMVVEDNFILRKMDSLALTKVMHDRAEKLWGAGYEVFKCIAPIDDTLIVELSELGWQFVPTTLTNLDTAIQKVRHSITHRRGIPLFIHERCEDLKRQLKDASWDSTRKRFERSDIDGFYPLVTALVCWRLDMNEKHDPTPEHAWSRRTLVHPGQDVARTAKVTSVRRLFGVR